MMHVKIFQLSATHAKQYPQEPGVALEELLNRTTEAYVSLWNAAYAGNPDIARMRTAEGMDHPEKVRARLAAYIDSNITQAAYQELSTLQVGQDRTMFVALDSDSGKITGLAQVSSFNHSRFEEQRPKPLANLHQAVCVNEGLPLKTGLKKAFQGVGEIQADYHAGTDIQKGLLMVLLTQSPYSGLFVVSYPDKAGELEAVGYKAVAQTTTMDSGVPCFYMLASRKQAVKTVSNDSAREQAVEFIPLPAP
jgi:hypothetical protein